MLSAQSRTSTPSLPVLAPQPSAAIHLPDMRTQREVPHREAVAAHSLRKRPSAGSGEMSRERLQDTSGSTAARSAGREFAWLWLPPAFPAPRSCSTARRRPSPSWAARSWASSPSGCCGDAMGFTGGCGEDLTVGCGEDLMVGCAGDLMACGGDLGGGACVDDSDVRVEALWIACA